jgi:CubicO group peptidase (beta-lactamase class C family)
MLVVSVLSYRALIAGSRCKSPNHSDVIMRAIICAAMLIPTVNVNAQDIDGMALQKLSEGFDLATKKRVIVGAQLAVGTVRQPTMLLRSYGRVSPSDTSRVDNDTAFCIASCSKPLASACILSIVDKGRLDLDRPVSENIAGLPALQTLQRQPVTQAPTLRQILCHRGGFYSQKRRLTRPQTQAIRNFSLTLEQSAATILASTLDTLPGSKYSYSGAGYVVAGLATEKALDTPFETLLQTHLCKPLEMTSTTYFPLALRSRSIAIGGPIRGEDKPAPHLYGSNHRLPLIGGSIYSTAEDLGKFASMLLQAGESNAPAVLGETAYKELLRQQFSGQFYGLGWGLRIQNRKTTRLSHLGGLYSYRSSIVVDLQKGYFVALVYTLADPGNRSTDDQIKRDISLIQNDL